MWLLIWIKRVLKRLKPLVFQISSDFSRQSKVLEKKRRNKRGHQPSPPIVIKYQAGTWSLKLQVCISRLFQHLIQNQRVKILQISKISNFESFLHFENALPNHLKNLISFNDYYWKRCQFPLCILNQFSLMFHEKIGDRDTKTKIKFFEKFCKRFLHIF